MKSPLVLVICLLVATNAPTAIDASFWDSIPIVSQLKSLVQVASGDAEGAKKTQENFVNTAPVVSQVKSAMQAAAGDTEGARETQIEFGKNAEQLVDSLPVVGHIKGGIHVAIGDKDRGLDIIKGASSTTGAVVGGLLAGPAGAILGGAATDGLITGIDSAVNKEFRPFGLVEYGANIKDKNVGEHFDQLFGIGLDVAGGLTAKKTGSSKKEGNKKNAAEFGSEQQNVRGGIDEDFVHRWDADDMRIDYSAAQTLEIGRSRIHHLPQMYRDRLELIDFRDVNDVDGMTNCYFCTAAALKDLSVTQLMDEYGIGTRDVMHVATIDRIIDIYQRIGFQDVRVVFSGNIIQVRDFIEQNLHAGGAGSFALAFTRVDGSGHVVMVRVWRDIADANNVRYLVTDFQRPVSHAERFTTALPPAVVYYIFNPQTITRISEADLIDMVDDTMMSMMRSEEMDRRCNGKRIIGYLASWAKRDLPVKQAIRFTNIIYAFVKMDPNGGLTIPTDTLSKQRLLDAFVARKALALKGFELKISFAVGGWENSQHFSNVVADSRLRAHFISNIATVVRSFDFDGVDIDWEYPGTGGATEGREEDRNNYVTLLRELRSSIGSEKLISIAAAAGEEAMRGFDIANIVKYVDWIGVMSYDLNGAWDSQWGAFVGPNAPLYHGAPVGYSGKLNVDWAIKEYVCRSKMPKKIVMGIPFYGRYWSKTVDGIDPAAHPLFRKAQKVGNKYGGDKTYRELVNTWLTPGSGFDLRWDEKTRTPWAINTDASKLVLTYDDARSVKEKIEYAVQNKLGGVMVWSVDQDDHQLSLTNAMTGACAATDDSINFKCNPLNERRWWTYAEDEEKAGMCGKSSPLYKGYYPVCDPDDPGYACCSPQGYCGSGFQHCECQGCVDYGKNPEKLIAEPVKPSRKIQWHVGYDTVKSGQPRCGSAAPAINGFQAICNPDDDSSHCCSPAGYCGTGPEYCQCTGCKDFRKIPEAESLKRVRPKDQIRWHIGYDEVQPGEPRCGPTVKLVNGQTAICDPDDDAGYCCSKWGYCGVGDDFCKCEGCVDSRKINI